MLESLFLALLALTMLFSVLTIVHNDLIWPLVSVILWIILAVSVYKFEWVVTLAVDNAVVTSVVSHFNDSFIQYLFLGLGLIYSILFAYRFLDYRAPKQPAGGAQS